MDISLLRASGLAIVLIACAAAGCSDSSGPRFRTPAALGVVSGTPQEGESGEPLPMPLTVKATDKNGRVAAGAEVSFTITSGGGTLSAAVDTTDAAGIASVVWTLGSQLGAASVEARVTGVTTPAVFTATVKVGPPSALKLVSSPVGNSAAGFEVPDSVAVRVVDRFDHPIADATVVFVVTAGGGATSHAAKVSGSDGIVRTAWTLGAAGPQTLRATLGTIETAVSGTAVDCPETQLALGQVLPLSSGSPTCVRLSGSAQKFVVAVVNTTSSAGFSNGFRFRGAGSASTALTTAAAPSQFTPSAAFAAVVQEQSAADAHAELLQANAELLDRLGPNRRAQLRSQLRSLVQAAVVPNLGDVLPVNIPLEFSNVCSLTNAARIGGRVAYVGAHSVILEDTLAPLRGENDAVYAAVGQEFDNVMWPILTANYGNPLAMDAQLDGNNRIFMVFSPRINTVQGGAVAGFVTGGDFFTAQDCAASNVGEYFYARVPTKSGGGFDTDNTTVTVDEWLRSTRTVIMHEVKHVTSYAEKFASPDLLPSGFFTDDSWLEESTAMVAEELWARTIFGYAFRGNVDYAASVFCEVRPTNGACVGKPISMFDHFFWLSQYAAATETKSPVGSPASDLSVYGSGWLFIRWLLDQYATTEAAILGPLTTEALRPGVASIEAHINKSFTELIADWSLAFVLDDYPAITLSDEKHKILSWNLRDIYSNLNTDFSGQGFFLKPFPLTVRAAGFGQFLIDVGSVRGGSMSVAEISGEQNGQQLFEFKGVSGSDFPANLRVSIVRVQ